MRQSGGLLPPRTAGVVQRFEEESWRRGTRGCSRGEAQTTAGCTSWESVEEREQDTVDMGRLLEEDGSDFLLHSQCWVNDTEEAADMVGAVCGLCDGREGAVVGDCGAGIL